MKLKLICNVLLNPFTGNREWQLQWDNFMKQTHKLIITPKKVEAILSRQNHHQIWMQFKTQFAINSCNS